MKGYIIFQENIFDQAGFEKYKLMSPKSIERYGGEFMIRGGGIEILEGKFDFERIVVIQFPSVEQARSWYFSDEYEEAKAFRLKISAGQAELVEGL